MNMIDSAHTFFTPSEAATKLGLKVGSIYALLSRGELHAYHKGRRRLIPEVELERLKAKRTAVVVDMTYAFKLR